MKLTILYKKITLIPIQRSINGCQFVALCHPNCWKFEKFSANDFRTYNKRRISLVFVDI